MATAIPSIILNTKTLQDGDSNPLLKSLTSAEPMPPWTRVSGPTVGVLRIYLVESEGGSVPTRVDAGDNTLHLIGKVSAADTEFVLVVEFAKREDGNYFYYEADPFPLAIEQSFFGDKNTLEVQCDIIERNDEEDDVNTWRVTLNLKRGNGDGGADAPEYFLKVSGSQNLTTGQKEFGRDNLGLGIGDDVGFNSVGIAGTFSTDGGFITTDGNGSMQINNDLNVDGTFSIFSHTLSLGGNISFGATGRSLASAATSSAARTTLGLGASDSPSFSSVSASTATFGGVTTVYSDGELDINSGSINLKPSGYAAFAGGNAVFDTDGVLTCPGIVLLSNNLEMDGHSLTINGNVTFSGAYNFTGTLTGATTVTFPTSGTLATESIASAIALSSQSSVIASASSINLATATGKVVLITGTTAITSLGTVAAGAQFILQFQDVNAALTHNATTLRCHAGKSMQFYAGESAIVTSLGSGNWTASYLHVVGPYRSGGTGTNSERFGYASTAGGSNSAAFGYDAQASGAQSTSLGAISRASASGATAVGYGANVSGSNSVGVGTSGALASAFSVAIGSGAAIGSNETGSVCIGYNSVIANSGGVNGESVVVGREASGSNGRSTCIGFKATAGAVSATVLGRGAYAGISHGVALGRGAYTPAGGTNTVTLGYSGGDTATDIYFDSGSYSHYINQVTSETNTRTATLCRARLNGMAGADMAGLVGNMNGGDVALCGGQGSGTGVGGKAVLAVAPAGSSGVAKNALVDYFAVSPATGLEVYRTVTATVGDVTINRPAGTVNIAPGGTSVVVTNSMASTASNILYSLQTPDATARIAHVTKAAGLFTITLTAPATGQIEIGWLVLN